MKISGQSLSLSRSNLNLLKESVPIPIYQRKTNHPQIVHLGVGGFHRAHQAVYLDDLLNQGLTDWTICGIGILDSDKAMRDALATQDFLFTVVERNANKNQPRIVGSIQEMLLASENSEEVIDRLASPRTKIISLTITEKGYFYDTAKDELDINHPAIQEDLRNNGTYKTAIGYIVASLEKRASTHQEKVTILSCDNLMGNGDITRKALLSFIAIKNPKFAEWILQNVTFPNCMVDRITPVTTVEDKTWIEENFGIQDKWPVVCETFRQWVIEDHFCNGRPPWEKVGVELLDNVKPYEKMKIRLLNGGHSALAYLAYLMGYRLVHEAAQDPLLSKFLRRLMDEEITSTLDPVPKINLSDYKDSLIQRFSNPAICDQIQRLAMDGSQKLPNNLIACVSDRLKAEKSTKLLALALAGWIRYLQGIDEEGNPIPITDPRKEELTTLSQSTDSLEGLQKFVSMKGIFDTKLADSSPFIQELDSALKNIKKFGTKNTILSYIQ